MFTWLRKMFRDAALAGIADAAEILKGQAKEAKLPEDGEAYLEERLRALPAPDEKKRRSAV